ncbi:MULTISPECIES: class I SAM-dependent methyltransferase [unclassified Paenibacillus]|uniref:class I SAM-dependent methyltransferase n=1 Tax=unclassified Paenibacillus TaxID=185978 RepID=UPI0009570B9D|nr:MULTISPECIES: class I SAM-dependent methyltransferase [unclassified Paenibacillus]ASS65506.2 class I SAM-dependent methyltransferase [Paenibacillus sp. RUD330]SIQ33919.1 Methyltransferase domain-containing protein [Paenibacillus sp. RU4X]SIQ55614.1 Methyltransferase domain-containing protein [Paenibacillus sp. RU4T]
MSKTDFEEARESEKAYHAHLYETEEILEPGSWLSEPIPAVMEYLELVIAGNPNPAVLDLGCGSGRNAIPIAKRLQEAGDGRLTGSDLLEEAASKLAENARKYGVEKQVEAVRCDAEKADYEPDAYDYVVACGCLEHVSSEDALKAVIGRLQQATRTGGIHCLAMNTGISERAAATGEELDAKIELNLPEEEADRLLRDAYADWNLLRDERNDVAVEEEKYEEKTEFTARSVLMVFQKS